MLLFTVLFTTYLTRIRGIIGVNICNTCDRSDKTKDGSCYLLNERHGYKYNKSTKQRQNVSLLKVLL